MPGKWKRPESIQFPSIWRKFDGRKEINGKIPKFWVQDLPEEMFDEAINFMCLNFINDEPLCKFSGFPDDPEAIAEIITAWRSVLPDKMTLVCFMENPDPNGKPIIAGLNMTYICEKGEDEPQYKNKTWLQVRDAVMYLCHQRDAFEQLGITVYLSALGLSVLPEFRGQGLGLEMLKARSDLCRGTGVPATLTVFSATASQNLAVKAGFKDIVQLSYDEIKEKVPRFTFPGINDHTKTIRFMYLMVD